MTVVVIANKKTAETLRYSIDDAWLPKILAWLKLDPPARYDAAMSAEALFDVQSAQ